MELDGLREGDDVGVTEEEELTVAVTEEEGVPVGVPVGLGSTMDHRRAIAPSVRPRRLTTT